MKHKETHVDSITKAIVPGLAGPNCQCQGCRAVELGEPTDLDGPNVPQSDEKDANPSEGEGNGESETEGEGGGNAPSEPTPPEILLMFGFSHYVKPKYGLAFEVDDLNNFNGVPKYYDVVPPLLDHDRVAVVVYASGAHKHEFGVWFTGKDSLAWQPIGQNWHPLPPNVRSHEEILEWLGYEAISK